MCTKLVMVVADAASRARVAQVAVGPPPGRRDYDAGTGTILTSNGDAGGTLSVIRASRANSYAVRQTVVTQQGAKTMAMDAATHTVYLPALKDGVFGVTVVAPR